MVYSIVIENKEDGCVEKFDQSRADARFLKGEYREAFEMYFEGATRHRDPRAAFDVAYMYHRGFYVPRNYKLAHEFYGAAALLEGGAAEYNRALLYIRGQGTAADFQMAARHMKRAAALGCADARLYLGVAYTTGCMFDPLDIECLSMIPFYRVIRRDPNQLLLNGLGADPDVEARRFEAIEADEVAAVEMFEAAASVEDDTYMDKQIGTAKMMMGQALVEGVGKEYDPQRGYELLVSAAVDHGSREAAALLVERAEAAAAYGVRADVIGLLFD